MEKKPQREEQDQLDRELDDSFPASDPPSMTQPKTRTGSPDDKKTPEDELPRRQEKETDTGAKQRDK